MASKQSSAVTKLYRSWVEIPTQNPDWSLEDQRDLVEGWNVLTAEPGGVDYVEAEAGGLPALWAIPKGALDGHGLLCIHGGGFHHRLRLHRARAEAA